MIKILDQSVFCLSTRNTTYIFQKLPSGHLEHLYYGSLLPGVTGEEARAFSEKRGCETGNMIVYSQDDKTLLLEDTCLEVSGEGKGDIREPFLEVIRSDGSRTTDFLFEKAEVLQEKGAYDDLPGSYGMEPGEHLCVTLRDTLGDLAFELHYYVYENEDVICRSARLMNQSDSAVRIERLMSAQLDLRGCGYVMSTFTGAWAREMDRTDTVVLAGKHQVSSCAGTSSNRANPFVMFSDPGAGEDHGRCIGMNLIYSGNHCELAEVNAYGKTRILTGIEPRGFSWTLEPQESFQAPEAVLTFSGKGWTGLSLNMHRFVREHIVRGKWKEKERPVLLNSWEAAYFQFDEGRLMKLAKAAADAGIELFVLDDGWFGKRNDDTSSLGDWTENRKKLPGGLKGLSGKIRSLGMDFGIWVEPEMVNVDSDLYRNHPEWELSIPGRAHSEGRNQRILDLTNPDVVDYLTEAMTSVFSSGDISYVKWDMNRIFSDAFSQYLPAERQGEVFHRYICGLYSLMGRLTESFPDILFEGCASGGCRSDLGILCYFPQMWASDNTDPLCRAAIQEGYSYGYPQSVVSAHVSASPNHQTLRATPLETRFGVAAFGLLGYELNLCDLRKEELDEVRDQIKWYKKWRDVLQFGDLYRGMEPTWLGAGNISSRYPGATDAFPVEYTWTCVARDRSRAVGFALQPLVRPNVQYHRFAARGLDPDKRYSFSNISRKVDIRRFGDLINTQSPVHIRQDSLSHRVAAKFVKMDGEKEKYTSLSGAALMEAGVSLTGSYTGTGMSDQVRCYQDFDSRIFVMRETGGTGDESSGDVEEENV